MQYYAFLTLVSFVAAEKSAFCIASGVAATTGVQGTDGKPMCSSSIQGILPDVNKMVSSIIANPASGSSVVGAAGFQVEFTTTNLASGLLQDVEKVYLQIPQTVQPASGLIQGASSISIQQLNDKTKAPSALQVSFHAISNAAADAAGTTNHVIKVPPGTLPAGLYRACTFALSVSGAPVIMPVAQRYLFLFNLLRGAQDDCVRFTVK